MASLTLKNIKKILAYVEEKWKKVKKGKELTEKQVSLQITEQGVVAVKEFNLEV